MFSPRLPKVQGTSAREMGYHLKCKKNVCISSQVWQHTFVWHLKPFSNETYCNLESILFCMRTHKNTLLSHSLQIVCWRCAAQYASSHIDCTIFVAILQTYSHCLLILPSPSSITSSPHRTVMLWHWNVWAWELLGNIGSWGSLVFCHFIQRFLWHNPRSKSVVQQLKISASS